MTELFTSFTVYLTTSPWLELIAMLLALAYAILAAQGSIWCWPAAFVSTALYTIVFYDVLLLMDSALNGYYLLMAVYGYWLWQQQSSADVTKGVTQGVTKGNTEHVRFAVIAHSLLWHVKICAGLTLLSFALGYVMANYTAADFAYLDTFTTVFAIFATYLVTQKVLENWLYWLVIDAVSIYLYIEKGLLATAVLFIIYLVIASYGYLKWLAIYKENQQKQTLCAQTAAG